MQKLLIKQAGDTLQNGGAFKRWLYRGQKPGWIAKFLNRMWANAASRNAMSNGLVALEVIGRKSGRVLSFPLVITRSGFAIYAPLAEKRFFAAADMKTFYSKRYLPMSVLLY